MPLTLVLNRNTQFNFLKWYTPNTRIVSHVIFWCLVALLYFFTYSRLAGNHKWLFILKDLFTITTIFYLTSSFVISKWLLKGKVLLVLVWVIFIYLWWIGLTTIAANIAWKYLPEPSERWARYLSLFPTDDFFRSFRFENIPIFILDFIYLVSLPIGPKFMKVVMEQANRRTELERDNLALELDFLKSQISPHFLFNTLNNIYQMSVTVDRKTPETVLRLSDMMRYLLYESKKEWIPLKQEIKFIRDYIELARIRYDNNFSLDVNIQEIKEPYKIAPLLLIPFVENAFKHGPDRSLQNGWIKIFIKVEKDILYLNIKNGINQEADRPIQGGFGLKNIKQRLNLSYSGKHKLYIKEEKDIFLIELQIDLK